MRCGAAHVLLSDVTLGGILLPRNRHRCQIERCWRVVDLHFFLQALNRIHRIGQTQPVTVYKLVVKDTVEQRILKLQAKKAALAEGALSMSKQKLSEMRLEDLKMLFSSY